MANSVDRAGKVGQPKCRGRSSEMTKSVDRTRRVGRPSRARSVNRSHWIGRPKTPRGSGDAGTIPPPPKSNAARQRFSSPAAEPLSHSASRRQSHRAQMNAAACPIAKHLLDIRHQSDTETPITIIFGLPLPQIICSSKLEHRISEQTQQQLLLFVSRHRSLHIFVSSLNIQGTSQQMREDRIS